MKKIKGLLIGLLVLILLTACGVDEGNSIEDCMDNGNCRYPNKDVRTEGSVLSKRLSEIIINDEDDMIFYYGINPGGDHFSLVYTSIEEINHTSFDQVISLFKEANIIIQELYNFDHVEFSAFFDEHMEMDIKFDVYNEVTYVHFDFDYVSSREFEEMEASEFNDFVVDYINEYHEQLKICLDYQLTDSIFFLGSYPMFITFTIEGDSIYIYRHFRTKTIVVDNILEDLFSDYNFENYSD